MAQASATGQVGVDGGVGEDNVAEVTAGDECMLTLMFGVGLHFSLRDLWAVRSIAVPGAITYWTSMGELTGAMFHARFEKCPAKLRPPEYGSLAVFFIWRSAPMGSSPNAIIFTDWR